MHKQPVCFDKEEFRRLFLENFIINIASGDAFLVDRKGHNENATGTVPYYTFEDGRRWYFNDDGVKCRQHVYTTETQFPNNNILVEVVIGHGKLEQDESAAAIEEPSTTSNSTQSSQQTKRSYKEKMKDKQPDVQDGVISVPWIAMFNICSGKRWAPKPGITRIKDKFTLKQIILSVAHLFKRDRGGNKCLWREVRVYGDVWTENTLEIPDYFLAPFFCEYITRFESEVLEPLSRLQG